MASSQRNSDSFIPIAQEDLEQFLKDVDCIDLVKRLREDGLATCISIPPGETFTTVCEKMRQVAFSANIRDRIIKHLTEKVESVIMTNRMSLALLWLGLLIDEARQTENLSRKTVLDDFLKQFFDHVDKLKNETKNDPETVVLAQALKMPEEDIPNATAALSFFPQIRDLYRASPDRDPSVPIDYPVDDSVWIQQLLTCGKNTGIDLYPFADVLEMSSGQIKHLILQKQVTLMKECRVSVEPSNQSNAVDPPSPENLPATFYSSEHLKPTNASPTDLPPLQVQKGDQVYCFEKVNYPWKLWNVLRVNRSVLQVYDPTNPSVKKEVNADNAATFRNAAAEGLWFPVGTLVVAWFDDGTNTTPFGYTDKYYHGIVIEGPCIWNRFRYMVFFEKGEQAYVRPDFVCRRLKQWEDNSSQLQELHDPLLFLKDYFAKWPKRPFVMADVGQTLSCSYYGKMYSSVVEEIDCSLFRIRPYTDKTTEWIHRGSRRFELMAIYLVSNLQETGGATAHRPHRISSSSACVEVATWQDNGPVNKNGELLPNDDTFCQSRTIFRKHKPVAKKSTVSGVKIYFARKKRSKSPPPNKSAEELQGTLVNEELSNRRGGRPDSRPPNFTSHSCSNLCTAEESAFFDKNGGLKGRNPLTLPLLCGWTRLLSAQPPQQMIYYSPCGLQIKDFAGVDWFLRQTGSRLTIEMFAFEREVDVTKRFETTSPAFVLNDMSKNSEPYQPVLFVNKFNNEMFEKFSYTNECKLSENIKSKGSEDDYLVGCECEDGCRDPTKCFCSRLTAASAGQPNATNIGYEFRRLTKQVPTGIYECNRKCKCQCNPDQCLNRVVQRGMRVRLQVFKTEGKGWGVQTIDDLPAGQFICTYSGEIFSSEEADEIGQQNGDEFLYDLDFLDSAIRHKQHGDTNDGGSDCSSEDGRTAMEVCSATPEGATSGTSPEQGTHQEAYSASLVRIYHGTADNYAYVMDAKRFGNLSRFFNHSCDPILTVQSVFVNSHDLRLPVIAFFTSRRIRAGEELTWDYSYEPGSVPGRKIDCKCGAAACRGRLL